VGLVPTTLRFYGTPSDVAPLDWTYVEAALRDAGTYWVVSVPEAARHPHPRPVWGVWLDSALWLTIGSPRVNAEVAARPNVTVHLDSGVDVVIVEGTAASSSGDPAAFLAAYDAKYDWTYDIDQYGPPLRVQVSDVIAWRSAGFAGRDGFQQGGRWRRESM
jgi:hypothetical protein